MVHPLCTPQQHRKVLTGNNCRSCDQLHQIDARKLARREGRCISCLKRAPEAGYVVCGYCRKAHSDWTKAHRLIWKYEAFAMFGGPICVCCGETELEFLSLEHPNGGGTEFRRRTEETTYRWLRTHNYPKNIKLEILCMNCQFGRKSGNGRCPHEFNTR